MSIFENEEGRVKKEECKLTSKNSSFFFYDNKGYFAKRLEQLRKRLTELGSKRVFLEDGSWYWLLKPDLKKGEVWREFVKGN